MPCCDPFPDYAPSWGNSSNRSKNKTDSKKFKELKEELAKLGKQYNELKERADKTTQLLCYTCGILREKKITDYDERLADWMKEHDEWDNERTLKTFKTIWPDGVTKREAYSHFVAEAEKVHPLSNWHKTVFFYRIWTAYGEWLKEKDTAAKEIKELQERIKHLETLMK